LILNLGNNNNNSIRNTTSIMMGDNMSIYQSLKGLDPSTDYNDFILIATKHIISQQQQKRTQFHKFQRNFQTQNEQNNPEISTQNYPNSQTPSFQMNNISPLSYSIFNSASNYVPYYSQPPQNVHPFPHSSVGKSDNPTTTQMSTVVLFCCLANGHLFLVEDTLTSLVQYNNVPYRFQQHALEYSLSLYQHDFLNNLKRKNNEKNQEQKWNNNSLQNSTQSSTLPITNPPLSSDTYLHQLPHLTIPPHLLHAAHHDLHVFTNEPPQYRTGSSSQINNHGYYSSTPSMHADFNDGSGNEMGFNRFRVVACEPLSTLLSMYAHPIIVSTNQSIQRELFESGNWIGNNQGSDNIGQNNQKNIFDRNSNNNDNIESQLDQYQQQHPLLSNNDQYSISPFDSIATQPITDPFSPVSSNQQNNQKNINNSNTKNNPQNSISNQSNASTDLFSPQVGGNSTGIGAGGLNQTGNSVQNLGANSTSQHFGTNPGNIGNFGGNVVLNKNNNQNGLEFVNLSLCFGSKELFQPIIYNARIWSVISTNDVVKHLLKHISQQRGVR